MLLWCVFHKCYKKSADVSFILNTTLLFTQSRIVLILHFAQFPYAIAYVLLWPGILLWLFFTSYGFSICEHGSHFLFTESRSRIWNLIIKLFLFKLLQCSQTDISSPFIIHSLFSSAQHTGSDVMFTSGSLIKRWIMLEATMPMGYQ